MSDESALARREFVWANDSVSTDYRYAIRSARLLEKFPSDFQNVEVPESQSFGRLLRLDGSFTVSEKDEFFHHGNLVHVPACTHEMPKTALIVGGGDGGAAEELLKHECIKHVALMEIDQAVVDIARHDFYKVHRGVIDAEGGDARLHIRIHDGLDYIKATKEEYDWMILDLPDLGEPSKSLYSAAFYQACAAKFKPGGSMSLHVASPFAHPTRVVGTLTNLCAAFAVVRPYLVSVPLSGGRWMMATVSESLDPARPKPTQADQRLADRAVTSLQYYNGCIH